MKNQPYVYQVNVEKDGVLYAGTYTVKHENVTVSYGEMQKKGHVGSMQPETVAKILLREILRDTVKEEPWMEP
jgi:hypothetical protein